MELVYSDISYIGIKLRILKLLSIFLRDIRESDNYSVELHLCRIICNFLSLIPSDKFRNSSISGD
jgi:hypothetical protein